MLITRLARQSQRRRTAAIFTRLVDFCWSLFQWCLLLAVVAAVGMGGYVYFRLDDEIRRQIEHRLAAHYSKLQVEVGRARFEQDRGIAISDLRISGAEPGGTIRPLALIDEMYLAGKVRMEELLTGSLPIDEVVVRRASLRAAHQPDGTWNVKALLPLPHFGEQCPLVRIEDATLVLEDATQGSGVMQTIQEIDLVLEPATAADHMTPLKGRFHVTGTAAGLPAREIRIEGEIGTADGVVDVTISAAGLQISSELITALPGVEVADLRGLELSGRADAKVRLSRTGNEALLNWVAEAKIDRGRVIHPMLPDAFNEITCVARADQHRLTIQRLDGKCGTASIAIAAERTGWSARAPAAVAAKIVGLTLNDPLRSRLPSALDRVWQRFQPSGVVDAEVRMTFDGHQWHPHVAADCRGLLLTDAEKFPYVLQQTIGKVDYQPAAAGSNDILRLDLTGSGGGRPIQIKAELTQLATDEADPAAPQHPVGWIEVTGADVPLHEELVAAIPARGESLVRSLRPHGSVDFQFRAEWKTKAQPQADVVQQIRLKDCSIQFEGFPYPLRNVEGLVTCQNWQWTLQDVVARGGSNATIVKCRGATVPRDTEFQTNLTFEAADVPLDDNLRLALSPQVQRAWAELQPQGRIDFTAHVTHDTAWEKPVIEVGLRPRDRSVSIELAKFPYRFEQVDGQATYKAGRVEIRNALARHDRVEYSAAAVECEPTPDGGWQVLLNGFNSDHFALHHDLLVALPAELRQAIERLRPTGTLNIHGSSLGFAVSPRAPGVKMAWDVNLICVQTALGDAFPVRGLTGAVRLVGRHDDQNSYTAGEMDFDSLVWKDVQLTNVHGPLWIDKSVCLLGEQATQKLSKPPQRITADAYGGSLTANAQLQHGENNSYQLDLALGGADLARFANERLGGPQDMSGTVSGRLIIGGTGQSAQSLNGHGELHVVDANIYELPALVAMLKVLKYRNPDKTAFNRCDMQFTVQGEQIHFQHLNMLGDAISLYGKGQSDLNRRVDLVFYTLIEPATLSMPWLKTIAGQVSQQALQLKVVGTWDDVEVQPETLPGVNQVIEMIQTELGGQAPATATRGTAAPAR